MKQKAKGIERQYRLIGDDSGCGYCYGLFTTEESPDCHFRISFNAGSFLFRLGIAPDLVICADEKTFILPGMQDYDDTRTSWFFPVSDGDLKAIAKSDCIKSMCVRTPIGSLDLYGEESNVWRHFFLAGVAECIEEVDKSRELEEFYVQRRLAAIRHNLKNRINASPEAWDRLSEMATGADGDSVL